MRLSPHTAMVCHHHCKFYSPGLSPISQVCWPLSGETLMGTESCFCRRSVSWRVQECFLQEVGLDQGEIWIKVLRNRGNSFGKDVKV